MGRLVGIDLGTTTSVVAVMDGGQPRILENKEGKRETPSVVGPKKRRTREGVKGAELAVGDPALDNWARAPNDTVVSVKRLMGREVADSEVERMREWARYRIVEPSDGTRDSVRVVIGEVEYSPIEISAMILRKLKQDAEFRLGEGVTHAVITVPPYFSHEQRDATRKAGLQAGLKVIRILDEPTAAAAACGLDSQEGADARTVLVYDLGGGTVDISVLIIAGGTLAPLSLEGDVWLGGDNFDQALVGHVVAQVRDEHGIDATTNQRFMVELKKASQQAKETLSFAQTADLIVAGLLQDDGDLIDVDSEVTREEFEEMIRPDVDRTVSLVRKALQKASLDAEEIESVLLAGNATTTPLVQQAIEEMFGESKALCKVHPKECVAIGAAIVAVQFGATMVCGALDPSDPRRECGHVNEPDAETCANCGAALEIEEKAPVELHVEDVPIPGVPHGVLARSEMEAKIGIYRSPGDRARLLMNQGRREDAMALWREQERISREAADRSGLLVSLSQQAAILHDRGELDDAMVFLGEAEAISRETGDVATQLSVLGNQALVFAARGELDQAMALLQEREGICRQLGDEAGVQASLRGQANILEGRNEFGEAARLLREAGAAEAGEQERAQLDPVDCTVFGPPAARQREQFLVQVFAHMPEQADDAAALASEFSETAQRRGFKSLGMEIARAAQLTFDLLMPGLEIDEPVQSLAWNGRPEAVQFGVTVPEDREPGTLIATVAASVDSVPVGHIKFEFEVAAAGAEPPRGESQPIGDDAHHYRMAFCSYASEDRDAVVPRVQMLTALGIRYFQDILDLDPGDRWEQELYKRIDQCDLFLLFWSSNVKQEKAPNWVRKEVGYALERKRGRELAPPEIRPIIIEGPPVPTPWEEVSHLHFNDRLIYVMPND